MRKKDSKFTIGKYHINTMKIIKLLQVSIFMPVTRFPGLTIWLFCKRRLFQIFGQFGSFSKKPLAKIGHFALRKKGREKTQLAKRWMVDLWWTREKKHFNLQSVKLTFLSFFQYKACILTFFMPCKM